MLSRWIANQSNHLINPHDGNAYPKSKNMLVPLLLLLCDQTFELTRVIVSACEMVFAVILAGVHCHWLSDKGTQLAAKQAPTKKSEPQGPPDF